MPFPRQPSQLEYSILAKDARDWARTHAHRQQYKQSGFECSGRIGQLSVRQAGDVMRIATTWGSHATCDACASAEVYARRRANVGG